MFPIGYRTTGNFTENGINPGPPPFGVVGIWVDAVKARYLVTKPRNLQWLETTGYRIQYAHKTRKRSRLAEEEAGRALPRAAGRVGRWLKLKSFTILTCSAVVISSCYWACWVISVKQSGLQRRRVAKIGPAALGSNPSLFKRKGARIRRFVLFCLCFSCLFRLMLLLFCPAQQTPDGDNTSLKARSHGQTKASLHRHNVSSIWSAY